MAKEAGPEHLSEWSSMAEAARLPQTLGEAAVAQVTRLLLEEDAPGAEECPRLCQGRREFRGLRTLERVAPSEGAP